MHLRINVNFSKYIVPVQKMFCYFKKYFNSTIAATEFWPSLSVVYALVSLRLTFGIDIQKFVNVILHS
jgi:hypothetical protein